VTTLSQALLDTDILSAVMRKNPSAIERARSYLAVYRQFTFLSLLDMKSYAVCSPKGHQNSYPQLINCVPRAEYYPSPIQ
jgi:hypothetical protein